MLYRPWEQAPDQIAWEILLGAGGFSYDQFIHYPHEGGTIPVSALARFVRLFTEFSSLTLAALILDFLSRYIQLFVVRAIFDKRVLRAFGLWTIFALPSIVPWGTVNFGLHSISSLFPFVLLYFLSLDRSSSQQRLLEGGFLGLAIWFSYINIVLVPAYVVYLFVRGAAGREWAYSLSSMAVVLFLHAAVRANVDAGFHLAEFGLASIRGTDSALQDLRTWARMIWVWVEVLPDSAMAAPNAKYVVRPLRHVWLLTVVVGLSGFLVGVAKGQFARSVGVGFTVIVAFMILYSLSPFYYDSPKLGSYVSYRHLAYILPLFAVLVISGFRSLRYGTPLLVVFLLLSAYGSGALFTEGRAHSSTVKAGGWVLGTKLGHDPARLYRIILFSSEDHALLVQGMGWGMSTALFENAASETPESLHQKIDVLAVAVREFPEESRQDLLEGINFGFSDQVYPLLDKEILERFLDRIESPRSPR